MKRKAKDSVEEILEEEELEDDSEDDEEPEEDDSISGSESSDGASEDGDSDSEELEDEDPDDTTVDVTLEFFDPKKADFLGLKALLQSYLDGRAYACSELVDVIIKQPTVGTVVKSGDDEDPIGVFTALNTTRYAEMQSLADTKQYLLEHCSEEGTRAKISAAWEQPRTALLVSERLINCPPQLGPPLQQALFDEIEWATEDEPTAELRESFKLDRFIAFTRVFRDPTADAAAAGPSSSKKRQKADQQRQELAYVRPEDEFYHKHCSCSYTFATGRPVAKDELQPLRLVLLLTRQQIQAARQELDKVVGNAAASAD